MFEFHHAFDNAALDKSFKSRKYPRVYQSDSRCGAGDGTSVFHSSFGIAEIVDYA